MNVNHFELKKTAILFFDILNGYVPEAEPGKPLHRLRRGSHTWLDGVHFLRDEDRLSHRTPPFGWN